MCIRVCAGASSGIGLSLAKKLASQGLNVVMVALPDDKVPAGQPTLSKAAKEVQGQYKNVQVRAVGAVLGDFKGEYLSTIGEATADLPISLVFNNAGYMVTGFFEDSDWARHEANIGCNSTAAIALSHLFVRRMRDARLKGCITFTSSPANIIPSPFSCLYGATKAMVSHFATSLACELKPEGIDVAVIHPSPVATNFYAGAHAMPTLAFFKSTAGGPDHVADVLLRGIGRSVIVDQGYYPFVWKLALRLLEVGFLANIMPSFATTIADYAVLKKAQEERKAKAAAALKDISLSASAVAGSAPRVPGTGKAPLVVHSPPPAAVASASGAKSTGKGRRGSVSAASKR